MRETKCPVRHHGRDVYYMAKEGVYVGPQGEIPREDGVRNLFPMFAGLKRFLKTEAVSVEDPAAVAETFSFKYGRMFEKTKSSPEVPGLKELAREMFYEFDRKEVSDTLAGYTFLGQFIDHDMAFDVLRMVFPTGMAGPTPLLSDRSPSLDLDSLYGRFVRPDGSVEYDKRLYEKDGIRFILDKTTPSTGVFEKQYSNDLPRCRKLAVVADERSDENLGLSQTVVAFLRFHNAVVEFLKREGVPEKELFETARQMVVRHYQWIILYDFLPEMIDKSILAEVMAGMEKLDWLEPTEDPFIPVEFAGAAFRFGHSILQSSYDWNRFFSGPQTALFFNLFSFTGGEGLEGHDTVPSDWIIDWRLFYDFSYYGIKAPSQPNFSGIIDTKLIVNLRDLVEFDELDERNLAIRNLLRGRFLELPTGQEVVKALGSKLNGKPTLTPGQIASGPHGAIIKRHGFDTQTPLWYYILKEAELLGRFGYHLGPVGSYIVAETFVLLILRSEISILREKWNPRQKEPFIAPAGAPKGFGMADMIKFAHTEKEPLISLPDNTPTFSQKIAVFLHRMLDKFFDR